MNTSMSLTSKIDLLRSKGLSDQEIDQLLSIATSAAPVVAPQSQSESLPESLKTFAPLFADKPAEQWNEQVEDVLSKDKKIGKVLCVSLLVGFSAMGIFLLTSFNNIHTKATPPFFLIFIFVLSILIPIVYTFYTFYANDWYYNKIRFFLKKEAGGVIQTNEFNKINNKRNVSITPWVVGVSSLFCILFIVAGINDNLNQKVPDWSGTFLGILFIIVSACIYLCFLNKSANE